MKIAIVGMMGSGKTEIGQRLSAKMGFECVDLDARIEKTAGMSIVDIFERLGEARFREMESRALAELAERGEDFVLCCGGGVVLSGVNRAILLRNFVSVWLDVPLQELERRLSDQRSGRPLLCDAAWREKLKTLYESRSPVYEASAQLCYRWAPGHDAEESAAEIERLILARAVPGHPRE